MIETCILVIGSMFQIILYVLIGIAFNNYKVPYKIIFVSIASYILVGIGLTIWNVTSNFHLGASGTKAFNPLIIISLMSPSGNGRKSLTFR